MEAGLAQQLKGVPADPAAAAAALTAVLPARPPAAPLGLDALPLLVEVAQQRIVGLVEHVPREHLQAREDVTRAGGVLAALQPRAELACTEGEGGMLGGGD